MEETFVIALVITVYLIDLNGFFNGAWKNKIDLALSVVWSSLLIIALLVFGWRVVLGSILGSFVLGWLLRPIARRTAALLFHHDR